LLVKYGETTMFLWVLHVFCHEKNGDREATALLRPRQRLDAFAKELSDDVFAAKMDGKLNDAETAAAGE